MENIDAKNPTAAGSASRTGSTLFAALRNAVLTLLVLNVAAQFLPDAPQWITDNGNKYIVMRNAAENGTPALRHPAPEFFPMGGFHFVRHRGQVRSFYPEYYPVLAAKWWQATGDRGLVWLSMLGTAFSVGLLTLCMKGRRAYTAMLLAFATPMLFFSFLLWEMTWSVCLALTAWILLRNKRHLLAGAVLGASLLLREEAYFFAFALTVALIWRRDLRGAAKFLAGMAAPTIPVWLYQYLEFGHIFGLHGGNYYANNRSAGGTALPAMLKGIAWNCWHHLFRFDGFTDGKAGIWNTLCVLPSVVAVILGGFTARRLDKVKLAAGAAAVAGWLALTLAFFFRDRTHDAFAAAMITGAVGSNPLFMPFYLNWRRAWRSRSPAVRDAAVTVCVYMLLVPPLLTRNDIGLIYGARHFLCVMPLMLFLSVHLTRLDRPTRKSDFAAAAATAAILLQIGAFSALKNVAEEAADFERTLDALPEKTLVTDVFFLPEQTPRLFFSKSILQLDDRNAAELADHLRRTGKKDFLLILSAAPRFRRVANPALAEFLAHADITGPPRRFRRAAGSGFMDLHIFRCRLK